MTDEKDESSYPKIQSIYKRKENGQFDIKIYGAHRWLGEFSRPEFEYLQDNRWMLTEKIDGVNIHVTWQPWIAPEHPTWRDRMHMNNIPEQFQHDRLAYFGRNAQTELHPSIIAWMKEKLPITKFQELYPATPMVLYGEGVGPKIGDKTQKYSQTPDLILFDVWIDGYWLAHPDIVDIATKLGLRTVPIVGQGSLHRAVQLCYEGFQSRYGDFIAEGLVCKPLVELRMQNKERLITKVKYRDFKWERREGIV